MAGYVSEGGESYVAVVEVGCCNACGSFVSCGWIVVGEVEYGLAVGFFEVVCLVELSVDFLACVLCEVVYVLCP